MHAENKHESDQESTYGLQVTMRDSLGSQAGKDLSPTQS